MTKIKTLFIALGLGSITYFILIVLHVYSPVISDYFNQTEFNQEVWINWEESESTMDDRWNMVNDLVDNHELKGKSLTYIKKLLGEPTTENKYRITYNLGPTGHGINYGTLTLNFKENIVSEIKISQG